MKSRLGIVVEHAASVKPHAITAMTRLMIPPPGRLGPPLISLLSSLGPWPVLVPKPSPDLICGVS
jgi:hypothetical protein